MTLIEMKIKILSLIEEISPNNPELTEDPDILNKLNHVINQIQFELCRFKKLPARETMTVTEGEALELNDLDNFYQLKLIRGAKHEVINDLVVFDEAGEVNIYYYKYPTRITELNEATYKFELSDDVLEILPYGCAADLLKSDVSSQYGAVYANRYKEMIQSLDPRYSLGSIYVEGGIEI